MKQNDLTAVVEKRENDGYEEFAQGIQKQYNASSGPFFYTNVIGLWEAFIENLPTEGRQHYACNNCMHFIERYGGLVRVNDKGVKTPVMWGGTPPPFFQKSVVAMLKLIQDAEIVGVFVSSESVYGQPVTGEWHHMHAIPTLSQVWRSQKPNAYQRSASLLEDQKILTSALQKYNPDVVKQAMKLLEANALYRGEKVLGVATWLKNLQEQIKTARKNKDNVVWLAVATAPLGFAHIGVISTLLDDLADGMSFEAVTARFQAKMVTYQRSQAAPSAGNIDRGEQIIDEMNAAGSLQRRYATFKDIQEFVWVPASMKKLSKKAKEGGVFTNITPKVKVKPQSTSQIEIPAVVMTWQKFLKTILPNAVVMELKAPTTPERFAALVTAVNYDAPGILQWDDEANRNPVSWYYGGGVDAEIRRRVIAAGGQYENVDIGARLIWDTRDDLDLHVIAPSGEEIYYHNLKSRCGGYLDVDRNVHGETLSPIENTRWGHGMARPGRYQVYIQNYKFHPRAHESSMYGPSVPFKVELQVVDQVFSFEGETPANRIGDASNVIAFEFDYVPGKKITLHSVGALTNQQENKWNVTPNAYVPVTGIVLSPNLWGKHPQEQHGFHVFFLLNGCRDLDGKNARGFFSESLKSDYREIRSVLEAYNAHAGVSGIENAEACGVGMSNHADWDLTLRVTTDTGTSDYKIDRWD